MSRLTTKLAMVAVAVALVANVGMAFTVPPHAVAQYKTWLTNTYTYLSRETPYYMRSYGRVLGMPMFMLESIAAPVGGSGLVDTITFDRPILCPFIASSESTVNFTVKVFRDYNDPTPYEMVAPTVDGETAWFAFPGQAQEFIVTVSDADTGAANYYIIGGIALPVP